MVSFFSLFVSCNKTSTIPDVVGKCLVRVSWVFFSRRSITAFHRHMRPRLPSMPLCDRSTIHWFSLVFHFPFYFCYFIPVRCPSSSTWDSITVMYKRLSISSSFGFFIPFFFLLRLIRFSLFCPTWLVLSLCLDTNSISCRWTHGRLSTKSAHINHIRRVAGIDHVGIGAGYDGINTYVSYFGFHWGECNWFAHLACCLFIPFTVGVHAWYWLFLFLIGHLKDWRMSPSIRTSSPNCCRIQRGRKRIWGN